MYNVSNVDECRYALIYWHIKWLTWTLFNFDFTVPSRIQFWVCWGRLQNAKALRSAFCDTSVISVCYFRQLWWNWKSNMNKCDIIKKLIHSLKALSTTFSSGCNLHSWVLREGTQSLWTRRVDYILSHTDSTVRASYRQGDWQPNNSLPLTSQALSEASTPSFEWKLKFIVGR